MNAGCDINCGNTYLHLKQALTDGLITEEQVTEAAVRAFTTRYLLGLFDEMCEYNAINYQKNDSQANANQALAAARKSMVLLKNDGILPLDKDKLRAIAVIGPNADSQIALEGNYNGTSSRYVTFLEGIRAACGEDIRVNYSTGAHLYKRRSTDLAEQDDDRLAEAVAMAHISDVVILCLGLDSTIEGEAGDASNEYSSGDKVDLELPKSQRQLVDAILMTGKPVITVVAAGSALRVEEGNAILWAWYPGQAGGTALADILFGKVSPSGKLPVTFYHSADELPSLRITPCAAVPTAISRARRCIPSAMA